MFAKGWQLGTEPPSWLMKEFKRALFLMGRNREVVHAFDAGLQAEWTFVIGLAPRTNADKLFNLINSAISGSVIDSQCFYPDKPRNAVHGDLYP